MKIQTSSSTSTTATWASRPNDGSGIFTALYVVHMAIPHGFIAVSDMDGDGLLDLAYPTGIGTTEIWRGDGLGGFEPEQTLSRRLDGIECRDVDGANGPDLVGFDGYDILVALNSPGSASVDEAGLASDRLALQVIPSVLGSGGCEIRLRSGASGPAELPVTIVGATGRVVSEVLLRRDRPSGLRGTGEEQTPRVAW